MVPKNGGECRRVARSISMDRGCWVSSPWFCLFGPGVPRGFSPFTRRSDLQDVPLPYPPASLASPSQFFSHKENEQVGRRCEQGALRCGKPLRRLKTSGRQGLALTRSNSGPYRSRHFPRHPLPFRTRAASSAHDSKSSS